MADERLIMIADDDPDIREVVRILLESEGFRIVEAVGRRRRRFQNRSGN